MTTADDLRAAAALVKALSLSLQLPPEGQAEADAFCTRFHAHADTIERVERDAERYRWIRKRMDLIGTDDYREFDKDIDIAMHNSALRGDKS